MASKTILKLKEEKYQFIIDDLGFELPKIISSAAMLQLYNLSFSSVFLREDVYESIRDKFTTLSTSSTNLNDEDSGFIYFSTLFLLNDINKLSQNKIEYVIENLMNLHTRLSPSVSVPIFGLLKLFTQQNSQKIDESYIDNIAIVTKKLNKKYSDFARTTFSFKNAIDKHRMTELTKNFKNN